MTHQTATNQSEFWQDKTPCWEMCHCPENIRDSCPAPKHTGLPCWEIEGTYLKLSDNGERGDDTSICRVCRVYRRYGEGKPICVRLVGKGIDAYLRNLKLKTEAPEHLPPKGKGGCPGAFNGRLARAERA